MFGEGCVEYDVQSVVWFGNTDVPYLKYSNPVVASKILSKMAMIFFRAPGSSSNKQVQQTLCQKAKPN